MKGRDLVEAYERDEIRQLLLWRPFDVQPQIADLEDGMTTLRLVTDNYGEPVHSEMTESEILCNGEVLAVTPFLEEIDGGFPDTPMIVRNKWDLINPLLGLYDARITHFDGEPLVTFDNVRPLRKVNLRPGHERDVE